MPDREAPSAHIGERLARYRKLAGMSAQDLSDATMGQLSRAVIANIERGQKKDITVDELVALSWALGIPPVALALPIERPNADVVVASGKLGQLSLYGAEAMYWMLSKPEPFKRDRESPRSPAGVVARSVIRGLGELSYIQGEVGRLEERLKLDESFADDLEERKRELEALRSELAELGVDLSTSD